MRVLINQDITATPFLNREHFDEIMRIFQSCSVIVKAEFNEGDCRLRIPAQKITLPEDVMNKLLVDGFDWVMDFTLTFIRSGVGDAAFFLTKV